MATHDLSAAHDLPAAHDLSAAHDLPASYHRPAPERRGPTAASYRRRRVVAGIGIGMVLFVVAGLGGDVAARVFGDRPASGSADATVAEPRVYVVQPGDTVWGIAEAIAPAGEDVRATVDAVVDAAGGAQLEIGQRIEIR